MHPNPQPPASSPQLRLVNSAQSIAPRLAFALAIASSAWAQNVVFSTHDWTAVLPAFGINQSYRQQLLAPLPAGGGVLSAQLVCLLSVPVVGSAPGCASLWTASPAIWFGW